MKTKAYRKLMLVPGYSCNNRCLFCINYDMRGMKPRSTVEILRQLKAERANGCNYLEFAGGEDAIRPDFCLLVKTARRLGYERVMVATNGRVFSYMDFAEKAVDSGLTDIVFSVHAPSEKLHDRLVQVEGCFRQAMTGIENILKLFRGTKNTIGTNTAITKLNYRKLPETGRMIAGRFGICNSEFIFADPSRGGVAHNFDMLMPRISEAAPYIRECLAIGREHFHRGIVENLISNWAARYVPLCYFTDFFPFQISDARENIVFSNVTHSTPEGNVADYLKARREVNRRKTAKCESCVLKEDCEGIWNRYLDVFGDDEFQPVADIDIRERKIKYIKDFLSCR